MDFKDLEERIDAQIKAAGINIMYDEFETYDPDVVFIRENKRPLIVINIVSDSDVPVVARKAHELSHVLDGDGSAKSYQFSIGFKNNAERIANRGMVWRLAKIIYEDIPLENRNYYDFMDWFNLPSSFEIVVNEVIREA
ncbi:hypothetical protein QG569_02805 [Weissella cibaria]|uniref:hypothetical protein n=1 Tax=Weissella cibaria TaxID=137591 RepID=UPI000E4B9A0F|nr:hypothetical protein [Weissella cibaria]MDK9677309.1 hypothetical protein [Weissella cibaria]RHE73767.1 hypothetical protein DW718_00645 [Weissella cibaria]RHE79502.1 hypothetical protein DW717_00645 [Weissella cibaria]